jgi:hypothetical protein
MVDDAWEGVMEEGERAFVGNVKAELEFRKVRIGNAVEQQQLAMLDESGSETKGDMTEARR